ncbi:arginine--tRNA ligase [Cohnella sp. REN36]|uniref:arginine--tRNA ligase n=1 Tax=Cohnella sp. REN36 TaxID=2887347 RepID=UPI001D138E26|nr:arginine--tRNA ligase [Cohnella sp. REN36]MCC3376838.1 arginine--tRNA ligase [Cohnella sp. REN36]
MISQTLVAHIEQSVKGWLRELGLEYPGHLTVYVEQPAHLEHGDYATNIAMQLAKVMRRPPLQIAEGLKERLEKNGLLGGLARSVEAAPPGFLNLRLDWGQWARTAFSLPANPDGKAVVEHTSINPNKSAHIGHLRNACIGDTLVRLLRRVGHEVEVHNYIDDLGNQLADTVVGLLHVPLQRTHTRFGDYCWDLYAQVNKAYETDTELAGRRAEVLHALEEGDGNVSWVGLTVAERIVREHLEEMEAFGIRYDLLVWESSIVREGFWASAFELLKSTPQFYRETSGKLEGCWVLRQPDSEAEDREAEHQTDKVLVRSNGILTYTAKDIAYHLWKFGLLNKDFRYKRFSDALSSTHLTGTEAAYGHADLVINVIDYRQQYPQAMVKQALEVLGYPEQAGKLRHVSYGVVSLSPSAAEELGIDTSSGKASYAMSGRQGIGIKVAELLDLMEGVIEDKRPEREGLPGRQIAAAAIRYYLLRFALSTEVVFDIQQATEITGNTGVYLMYAHARAASILSRAEADGVDAFAPGALDRIEKAEYALLRHVANWQDELLAASRDLAPNAICNYAHELATLFNNFYAACPILKAEGDIRAARLWLTSRFRETIADALDVLGLPAPIRM